MGTDLDTHIRAPLSASPRWRLVYENICIAHRGVPSVDTLRAAMVDQWGNYTKEVSCRNHRISSDASGGRWRAEELGRVISGLAPRAANVPVLTAARAVGDVGAASALLSIIAAISAGPGASLILASERSGSRRTAIAISGRRGGAMGLMPPLAAEAPQR